MKKKSSRHHYLPQFFIKGFTNNEEMVYVYDKEKDKISKNLKSPKNIFFERDKNTITINHNESSVIEDVFFQKLDNDSSKIIKNLQSNSVTKKMLSVENQSKIQFFLINLFWRLPISDVAVKDLIERGDILIEGMDTKTIKNPEGFGKVLRAVLYKETIEAFTNSQNLKFDNFTKMSEFDTDLFILGDYPMLFKTIPYKFIHLATMDFMFAISSRKIYKSTSFEYGKFKGLDGICYNISIIEQSKKYVVSGNKELLEKSIENYKKFKEQKELPLIKYHIFNKQSY